MNIQTTKTNGQYFSVVRTGGRVAYTSDRFVTRRMAEAAAKCWVVFHGTGIVVNPAEVFTIEPSRTNPTGRTVTGDHVIRAMAQAIKLGVSVRECTSDSGVQYIELHTGGSSYNKYHRVA